MKYIIAIIVLAIVAAAAHAEPEALKNGLFGGDTASLHMDGAYSGVLTYHNSEAQSSATGTWPIASDVVTCSITIIAKGAAPETASVKCGDGWVVEPETADVPDGQGFDFALMYQAY